MLMLLSFIQLSVSSLTPSLLVPLMFSVAIWVSLPSSFFLFCNVVPEPKPSLYCWLCMGWLFPLFCSTVLQVFF